MDTSVFISGQLIPIRMVSSPLSPSGECEGEKTELSPLSPLKGMRGDKRGGLEWFTSSHTSCLSLPPHDASSRLGSQDV